MVAPKPFSSDPPHRHTMHRPDSIREWTLGIRMGRSHARVHGGQQEFGIGIPLFAVLPYLPCNGGQRVRYSGAFNAFQDRTFPDGVPSRPFTMVNPGGIGLVVRRTSAHHATMRCIRRRCGYEIPRGRHGTSRTSNVDSIVARPPRLTQVVIRGIRTAETLGVGDGTVRYGVPAGGRDVESYDGAVRPHVQRDGDHAEHPHGNGLQRSIERVHPGHFTGGHPAQSQHPILHAMGVA